ncbi:MAG: hypothetical protein JCHSAcid_05500 [uncultured Acidilobus sp. JCHS]|nr:MAG: hypothetical protein JCHSAcid_05500 [uncultured Acidilobus sp. JCHS]
MQRVENETSATSGSSPPWNIAFTPADSYMGLFFFPTPSGVASTITSALDSISLTVPATLMPALSKASSEPSGT